MLFSRQGSSRRHLSKIALAVGTMLGSLASPVLGQTYSPPVRRPIDDNGVDVIRKTFDVNLSYISIGPEFPAGFVYGNRDSVNILSAYITRSGTTYYVTANGQSDSFTLSGSIFTNTEANGSTLVQSGAQYVYTTSDGVATTFSPNSAYYPYYQDGFAKALVVAFPDGTRWTYNYKAVQFCPGGVEGGICPAGYMYAQRLQGISSNRGYQVKFQFAANSIDNLNYEESFSEFRRIASVKLFNNAYAYCDLTANSCSPSGTWPSVTIANTSVAGGTGTTVVDNEGRATRVIYYTSGNIGIKRPGAVADNVTVGRSGTTVNYITRDGITYNYSYVSSGTTITTTVTNPSGKTKVYMGDTSTFLITSYKDELNRVTNYQYDTGGRLIRITEPEGNYTQYSYDARGNVTETRQVAKVGSGLPDIVTTAGYESSCSNAKTCNKPIWTKDAKGNQTDYSYDATSGGLLKVDLPAAAAGGVRPSTTYSYSDHQAYYYQTDYYNPSPTILPGGFTVRLATSVSTCQTLPTCSGGADEIKTSISYGPQTAGVANNLLPVSVSTGSGNGALTATTATTYDGMSNTLTIDGPLPGAADTTRYRYDNVRRRVGVVTPDPDGGGTRRPTATRISYNADDQVTMVQVGTVADQTDTAWTNFAESYRRTSSYDGNGRMIRQTVSASGTDFSVIDYVYDNLGRKSCSINYMNPANWGPQATNCAPLQINGPNGPDRVNRTNYDFASQVTSVEEGVGTTAAAITTASTYSDNGKLTTIKDGENNLTTYEYDGFDRLVRTRYPNAAKGASNSSTTDYVQLTYDINGNVINTRLRDGQNIAASFDNLNRVTFKNLPGTEVDVAYSYDLQGRIVGLSGATTLTNGYDALGRLITEGQAFGSMAYEYDLAGRRTRMGWSDGFFVNFDYDNVGGVTRIRENGASSGVGVLASYSYNDLGFRTATAFGNGTSVSYTPDAIARLVSMTQNLAGTAQDITLGFSFNPASQIKQATRSNNVYAWSGYVNINRPYASNGRNQYNTAGTASFSYDARGNLTGDGSGAYSYSSENLLKTAPGGVALYYDPLGRLQEYNTSTSVRFIYDGGHMTTEVANPSGSIMRRYVYGPGADEPIVWYEGAGTSDRRWLHADERGSIIAVTNASGASVGINSYDEYGIPAASNIGRFQYTGQAWLSGLGMYYFKSRIYSPTLGRFVQADPLGYADGPNAYAYVGNDPINYYDQNGTRRVTVGERALLRNVFGDLVDPVSVYKIPGITSSIAFPWEIDFTGSDYSNDFSSDFNAGRLYTFYHEFYHIFEYQTGISSFPQLAWNVLSTGHSNSIYQYDSSKSYMAQNPEARANYFAGCMTGGDCSALSGFHWTPDSQTTIKFKDGVFVIKYTPTGSLVPRTVTVGGNGKGGDTKVGGKGAGEKVKKK